MQYVACTSESGFLSEGPDDKAVRLDGRTRLHRTPNPDAAFGEGTSGYLFRRHTRVHEKPTNLISIPFVTKFEDKEIP